MKRKVEAQDINSYMMQQFGIIRENEFFECSPRERNAMINRAFESMSGYHLWRGSLRNKDNVKDEFDNYRSFDHIYSYAQIAQDIEITKQKSRDVINRSQRILHRVRKERFEVRKRKRLKEISKTEYLKKWSPKNKQTKQRLAKLEVLKEQEKGRDFER